MNRTRLTFGIGIVALAAVGLFVAHEQAGAQRSDFEHNPLMQRKLAEAQNILGALVLEDFKQIESSAGELVLISQEDQWTRRPSERYRNLALEFRWAAEKLKNEAEAKNLEGTTLAYMQVVMSCVECHKVVRGSELNAEPPPK